MTGLWVSCKKARRSQVRECDRDRWMTEQGSTRRVRGHECWTKNSAGIMTGQGMEEQRERERGEDRKRERKRESSALCIVFKNTVFISSSGGGVSDRCGVDYSNCIYGKWF